jgi:hypothetical protein
LFAVPFKAGKILFADFETPALRQEQGKLASRSTCAHLSLDGSQAFAVELRDIMMFSFGICGGLEDIHLWTRKITETVHISHRV